MNSVLITKILLAITFTVVSVFGGCWIMTICAAIADENGTDGQKVFCLVALLTY